MKKIMFNDKFGLTSAVLEQTKTMTRRFVIDSKRPHFKIGEIVAIAQSYHTLNKVGYVAPEWCEHTCESSAGYSNKMFVRADLMPHRIQITNIKVEHLQDISDEDCMNEGVIRWLDCFIVTGIIDRTHNRCFDTPREAFAALIDKVSGVGTWEADPLVEAYKFKLIQ